MTIHIRSRVVTVEGPRGTAIPPYFQFTETQRILFVLYQVQGDVAYAPKSLVVFGVQKANGRFRTIGKLTKDLSHIAVTFNRPEKNIISIELHHGARKGVATLRTVRTIINNLIIGVTRGFLYKMRYVYAHFPINVNIEKNKETGVHEVEIRYASSPIFVKAIFLFRLGIEKVGLEIARFRDQQF